MYKFHVWVKVCLCLDVRPNSTPIGEVDAKKRVDPGATRGRFKVPAWAAVRAITTSLSSKN